MTRAQDMGATSVKSAKSRAKRYVYRVLGVEMMRGTAALREHRLAVVLAGSASDKAAAARRAWARTQWNHDNQSYFDKHHYGSRAYVRPW